MQKKDDAFLKKLLATFKVEAQEHLKAISLGLIELEKTPSAEEQLRIVEEVFREAHSLKGAARSVNISDMESVCQAMENVLAGLKQSEITPSRELFDLCQQAVDRLELSLSSLEKGQAPEEALKAGELIEQMAQALKAPPDPTRQAAPDRAKEQVKEPRPASSPARTTLGETVRIHAAKLNSVLLQAEELLSVKLAVARHAAELREAHALFASWKRQWDKVQPALQAPERSERSLGFVSQVGDFYQSFEGRLGALTRSVEHEHRSLVGMVDNLLGEMKQLMMLPFSSLLEVFPKLVRDLCRDQGKEADLLISGGEIEADRRILEEIKDPLVHLVRNCIDHGIEKPPLRRQSGKSPAGKITIAVSQITGGKVEVLVSDDGAGIDAESVKSSALKAGVLPREKAEGLDEPEKVSLIFQSGVSTSAMITDISGRGLGLAIVQEKAEKLGGAVSVQALPGSGTTFRMILPLTIATFRGIVIRVGEQLFVIPTAHVERVMRMAAREVKTVENREVIRVSGQAVSLVRLGAVLGISGKQPATESADILHLILLGSAEKRMAFQADEILNEQEVLVKALGRQLSRLRNISGATVLASGRVVPILSVSGLIKSVVRAGDFSPASVESGEETEERRRKVLIAEDSITSRALLKNILESAGFDVKATVDGVDALTALKTEAFDLVVSDVDMPRMNGFDLTAKIRADGKLSALPVVLVTALGSREHRERGVEVGANAYIVKSNFDQGNLLETIRRLI